MTADPRARWAELLRAPNDSTAGDATASFLRHLSDTGFASTAEQLLAVNALAGTALPVGRADEVERLLESEVEAFATNYWSLAPSERLTAWSELSRRGAEAGRLRELEPGLDVESAPVADPVAEELAALIRTLFVLPPRARAIRRGEWLLANAPDAEKWRAALATLQRETPALAALEPQLQAILAPGGRESLAAFVEGATATDSRHTRSSDEGNLAGFVERVRQGRNEADEYGYEAADSARAKKIIWGGLIAVGLSLPFTCLGSVLNRSSRESAVPKVSNYTPPPTTPRYVPPSEPITAPNPLLHRYTPEEVAEFERYEREKADGDANPPPGYTRWRLAGRPRGVSADNWAATPKPAPDKNTVYLDGLQITACQNYDQGKIATRPKNYAAWVAAGKPGAAGYVPIPDPEFDPSPPR